MQINVTFDQSINSLPAGFVAAIDYVVNYYDSLFTNNVTINLHVGYGEINGQSLGSGDLGESEAANYVAESYSSVRNALRAEGAPGASTLPATSPLSGTLYVSQAEAQALGLTTSVSTNYVGFSSTLPFSYGINATPAANAYYFVGVVEHEISEDMGRVSLLDDEPSYYAPIDLYRYTSSGVRDLSTGGAGSTAYFSINNGNTNLGTWNNQLSNGDLADWYPSGPAPGGKDAYNDYSSPGVINVVSADDITLMEALGWEAGPTVTAQNFLVAGNQSVPISNYFSVGNPNGNSITEYVFEDEGGGSGYFTVGGVPQHDNQVITVPASNLNTVQYVGGSSAGSDTLLVGVYDSTTASNVWSSTFTATTPIQTDTNSFGSTSLAEIGNNYFLSMPGILTGPELQYNGAPVTAGEFGSYAPIGAAPTASGYEVAWKDPSSGEYSIWNTDSSGNLVSSSGAVSGTSSAVESAELVLQQDLNGDGTIGPPPPPPPTVLRTDTNSFGTTNLVEVGNVYALYPSSGTGPTLQYNGAPVTAGEFGSYAPIGAAPTASGYEVAWKDPSSGEYSIWNTDSSGNLVSSSGAVSGTSSAVESAELVLQQDLNGDGTIGPPPPPPPTVLRTDTNSFGTTNLVEVGNVYALYPSSGTGPTLQYNGAPVTAGEFGSYAPIGAAPTASGYEVAWKDPSSGEYSIWNTDSSGNLVSSSGAVSGTSSAVESAELVLQQDLNGDGTIGPPPPPPPTVLRTDTNSFGTTNLVEVGNVYALYPSSGTGPTLQYNGAPVTAGEFGSYAPIGAAPTASGYEVAWKDPSSGEYSIWNTDSSGNLVSSSGAVSGTSSAVESAELVLQQDLNGNGVIGSTLSTSQADALATASGFDEVDFLPTDTNLLSGNGANPHFSGPHTLSNFEFANDASSGTIHYDSPAANAMGPAQGGPEITTVPKGGATDGFAHAMQFDYDQSASGVGAPWSAPDVWQGDAMIGGTNHNTISQNIGFNQFHHS